MKLLCSVSSESNNQLSSSVEGLHYSATCVVCVDKDTGNESEDLWGEEQAEEAKPEESETVGWTIAKCPSGLQKLTVHWLQSQPEDSEERGGEGKTISNKLNGQKC